MKNIQVAFGSVLLALTGLWLLADTLLPQPFTWFSFRSVFVQYTGVLAIGTMSVAMLLALRPSWLEQRLHGLDKMYRLHKWLGIAALGLSVLHWWWAQGTKWMVGWGWLERPARRGPPAGGSGAGDLAQWLAGQRGVAEGLGEWAFYVAAILIGVALVKKVPYRWFRKTHALLAIAYGVLAWHSVVLLKPAYWAQPVGWAVALLLATGLVAAVLSLAGRIGADRRVGGVVQSLTYYPALRVLEGAVLLDPGWPGHRAGQFAFVTGDPREGPHPYTIASSWHPQERRHVFIVKELGDHTAHLHETVAVGDRVTVEGPYGRFDFDDDKPRQVWVGAGIGITPFIARMKQLAQAPAPARQAIDLFHPTRDYEQAAIDKLTADAKAANVNLHVLVSPRDGHLSAEQIRAAVPDWRSASVWFCGPAGFGDALRRDFRAHGLPARDFHQELFEFR